MRIILLALGAIAGLFVLAPAASGQGGGTEARGLPPADGGYAGFRSPSSVLTVYGPFNVRAQNSNKCLDIRGGTGAIADGTPAQIWDCYGPGQTNQQWYLADTGDPYVYYLRVRHSGKCLDVTGGPDAISNGVPVQQWSCLGYYQTNQKWYLSSYTANGRTIYQLNAIHSGKCLDVTGGIGAIDNGTPVQQWTCLGNQQTNQHWYLTTP
jgi:hypothetical protein